MKRKVIINIGTGSGVGKTTLALYIQSILEEHGAKVRVEEGNPDDTDEAILKKQMDMDNIMSEIAPEMDIVIRTTQLNRSGVSHNDIQSYNHPEGYKIRPQQEP
jgi:uridine kinase